MQQHLERMPLYITILRAVNKNKAKRLIKSIIIAHFSQICEFISILIDLSYWSVNQHKQHIQQEFAVFRPNFCKMFTHSLKRQYSIFISDFFIRFIFLLIFNSIYGL